MKVIKAVKFVYLRTLKACGGLLISYTLLIGANSFFSLFNLFVFKEIIDSANKQKTIFGMGILKLIIFWSIVSIINKILVKFSEYLWNLIDLRQTIHNTNDFVGKLSTLDLSNYENPQTYDKIWRSFNRIPWQLKYYLGSSIKLLEKSIELSASIIIFFVASPLGAIMLIVTNVIPIIVKSRFGEQTFNIYKADSETRRKFEYASSLITQRDTLIEIKQFQGFSFIKSKLLAIYGLFALKQKDLFKKIWLNLTVFEIIPIIATFIFLVSILFKLNDGSMTTGTFIFLFTNILVFNGALWNISYFLDALIADSHFIQDAIDFYNIERNIIFPKLSASRENRLLKKLKDPAIKIENVSFRYPNDTRMVLKNISLNISYGQNIAIIGENGAGKTTLVKLLLRVYDPSQGRILLNGVDLKEIPENILFKTYSTLFQSFGKFYLTIKENLEVGAGKKLADEDYIRVLKLSNAWNYVKNFDEKLDQQLGPNYTDGVDLSGGQWQQLAIAKALIRKTPVLILDEPTSAIDAKAETEIFDRLNHETKNNTIIFISHRFSTIKDAQRIIVMDKGTIIESGNHEELMKNKGKYANLYTLQAERYERN